MSDQVAAFRSRDEIESTIRSFTPLQWGRLKAVAKHFTFGRPIDPEDLLQEAFIRALDTRKCPADVDIVKFLIGVMRSVLSGEAEKAENQLTVVLSAVTTNDDQDEPVEFADPSPSIEEDLIDRQNAANIQRTILALFDDDPEARVIVEGDIAGWSAEDLRAYTGLDKTAYDSKRRLIRRRLNKADTRGGSHE